MTWGVSSSSTNGKLKEWFDEFGPESVKSYEIGAKMDFWEHKARLNVAGYIMDRANTQFDFDFYDTDSTQRTSSAR